MKGKLLYIVSVFVLVIGSVLPLGIQPVSGQVTEPPQIAPIIHEPCLPGQPCQDVDGNWYIQQDARLQSDALVDTKSTGGPDDYGYTWNDSVAYSWIDAASGTNTGLTDYSQTGPISLPFVFPFYENAYSQIYITSLGYLTFQNQMLDGQSEIPDVNEPNDVIAPHWAPNSPRLSTGWVRYKSGGTAPNRYFAVEWYQMEDQWDNTFTYEALLYENGNIKFQYKTIDRPGDTYWCTSSGIEDSEGLDGLAYLPYCENLPEPNTAVLYTRPGPLARVRVSPLYLGEFTKSEGINDFIFTVTNTGDLGNDTYDLSYTSTWPLTLLNASNQVALTDTDADSFIDTGPLAQGTSFDVLARVTTPAGLTTGNANTAFVTATSSLNLTKTKTVRLESTIPAPFAQTYAGLQPGRVNLDLIWSNLQTTSDFNQSYYSSEPAVAETPDYNFITVWSEVVFENDNFLGYILQYTQVDHFGQILRPVTDLTALSTEVGYQSMDWAPAIAVAPNGNIGISWERYIYNDSTSLYNYNIWFTVLNPAGNIISAPVNLTNNTEWGNYQEGNEIYFGNPSIAATNDNHFMISWDKSNYQEGLYEIFYTFRQSNGDTIVVPTKIADGIPGSLRYYSQSLTSLSDNRLLMTYGKSEYDDPYWYGDNKYRVYNSNGVLLKAETVTELWGDRTDSIQLSGGNILIANVINYWNEPCAIHYIILDGSTYAPIYYSSDLVHPSTPNYLYNLSVTKDNANRAILTWSNEDHSYLYYALINGTGPVSSGPAIFHTAQFGNQINLSYSGYGSTTNSWDSLANVDGTVSFNTALFGAAPGGSASIGINFANEGLTTASNASLTLTLGSGLTYNGDLSGIAPSIIGNTVTWDLPDLEYGDRDQFTVYVTVPAAAPIGTLYSLDLMLTSDGPESDPGNNTASAQVMSSLQVFLPALMK